MNPSGTSEGNSRVSTARIAQLNFKAAQREPTPASTPGIEITPKAPPLSQLAIFVVYGYSGSQKVKANRALLRTTHARIREYRKSTPWGSVLVVGDLNVCLSNNLDTDRPDLHTDADEPEAEVLRTFICTGRPIPLPSPTSKGSHAHPGRRTARPLKPNADSTTC